MNRHLESGLARSFQLADSGRLSGGPDSVAATAFWKAHQFTRRWAHHSGANSTEVVTSTGFTWTEMKLSAIGDSVFGVAEFVTDAIGPTTPKVRVLGRRVPCDPSAPAS
jgi:hypothetical protein